ncbi:MAG TPA: cysteine peptidase family C39 domain-containing protein [Bacteroidota bacterium]|nr:cysteine peptidase family C39 domain-containing protein [Bacteroidota bacterium]
MGRKLAVSIGVLGALAIELSVSWKMAHEAGLPLNNGATQHRREIIYLGSDGVEFQRASNSCGIAALSMVLRHFGIDDKTVELNRNIFKSPSGTSLATLQRICRRLGLEAEGWNIAATDLHDANFPVILYLNDRHFVVADSLDREENVFVRDPAVGRLKIPMEQLTQRWNGEALVFGNHKPTRR